MEPIISLPINLFCSILFGDAADKDCPQRIISRPISLGSGDYNHLVITYSSIGRLLKELDPNGDYIHVEIFSEEDQKQAGYTIQTPNGHAELWCKFDWEESNAKRFKLRKRSSKELRERMFKDTLSAEIADQLSIHRKFPERHAKQLAAEIAANYKAHDISAILKQLDLLETINIVEQQYEEPNKEEEKDSSKNEESKDSVDSDPNQSGGTGTDNNSTS